jgi:hypothetical protein
MGKFAVGNVVYSRRLGKGSIKKIDSDNKDFHYYVSFSDGTRAWTSERELSSEPIKEDKTK